MERSSFYKLCSLIKNKVGKDKFKSDSNVREATRQSNTTNFKGGEITGELRMGVFIRLMAGGSYCDLLLMYGLSQGSIYSSFHQAAKWVNATFTFPFVTALQNEDKQFFDDISAAFASDSGGTYNGCIGALDGLAVKIKRPTLTELLKDAGA